MRPMIALLCLLVATAALAGDHEKMALKTESGWFDFENCVFCRTLIEDPGLLEHSTWESHKIEDGMLTILTVDPAYEASLDEAMKNMEQVTADMESGKLNPMQAEMCGSCREYGAIMMAGGRMEHVEGEAAQVTLMTSDDEALVARIHKMCERHDREMAEMTGGGHEGHSHH